MRHELIDRFKEGQRCSGVCACNVCLCVMCVCVCGDINLRLERKKERKKERRGMREREHRSIKVHSESKAEQHNTRITKNK